MRRHTTATALFLLMLTAACGQETNQADAAPANNADASAAFLNGLAADAEQLEAKYIGLARAMTAEQYAWSPGEGVMSVAEVFMHVAAYNYFYPSLAGAEPPADAPVSSDYSTVSAFQDSTRDRDEIIAALEASFAHLRTMVAATSADGLASATEVFGSQSTVQEAWMGTFTHIHEHLGQSIAYARMNGVVPPWSM